MRSFENIKRGLPPTHPNNHSIPLSHILQAMHTHTASHTYTPKSSNHMAPNTMADNWIPVAEHEDGNEPMPPPPELVEPPVDQDLDWVVEVEFNDHDSELTEDRPTGPPTEAPALWFIGDDPTPRTLEYILEHRRTHALERADLALQASEQFDLAADRMVEDAAAEGLEVNEVELYNVRMEARRYRRIGRRFWKILMKQDAQRIVDAATSEEVEEPAPTSDTTRRQNRKRGFEERKAKRGRQVKPEDPTAGWAKRRPF